MREGAGRETLRRARLVSDCQNEDDEAKNAAYDRQAAQRVRAELYPRLQGWSEHKNTLNNVVEQTMIYSLVMDDLHAHEQRVNSQ